MSKSPIRVPSPITKNQIAFFKPLFCQRSSHHDQVRTIQSSAVFYSAGSFRSRFSFVGLIRQSNVNRQLISSGTIVCHIFSRCFNIIKKKKKSN